MRSTEDPNKYTIAGLALFLVAIGLIAIFVGLVHGVVTGH